MGKRLVKVMALVVLGALLATLPGLAGCAKDEKAEGREIVIGFLGDLTGPAAFAVKYVYGGLQDYFRMVEEEDPIAGVEIKIINFDTRGMAARVPEGHVWLKGQGTDIFFVLGAGDMEILADRFKEDEIPALGTQGTRELLDDPWIYTTGPPPETQAEVIMQWITDTWDYEELERLPRVGHLGCSGFQTTEAYQTGIDEFLAAAPGEVDWAGVERGPYMTTVWAPEVQKLIDCDFIIVSTVGPSATSFVKEARARGYEEAFVSGQEALPGFWPQMKAAVDPEDLHDCFWAGFFLSPWDPVPFMLEVREAVLKYRSAGEAEFLMEYPVHITGWVGGVVLADTIRRAVGELGAENVDGPALRDALAGIDMTLEEFWNPWRFTENIHCLFHGQRMFEWSIAEDEWVLIDDIYFPPSLAID